MSRIAALEGLDRDFRARLERLLRRTSAVMPTLQVFESLRSPRRQNELFARGRNPSKPDYGRTVTRARAYQSAHQHGLAVDLVFRAGDAWSWDEPFKGAWDELHRMARQEGLEPLSFEKPHLQAAGFDWRQLATGPLDDAGWTRWLRERGVPGSDDPTVPMRVVG